MHEYELKTVLTGSIETGDRFRGEIGDVSELVESFKNFGIIQTLAVSLNTGDGYKYKLLAGGRRLAAARAAGITEVPVKIYLGELTDLEMRGIELEENIKRKDLTFIEDCNLKREIHNLQVQIYGKKTSTSPDASGHSLRDTAKLLGVSHATVIEDIKLADAMENFPDLDWSKCKNKNEATKMLDKFSEKIFRADMADRVEKFTGKSLTKKMIDSYIVGDFFKLASSLPSGSFDLIEVDPPFSIDLENIKKSFDSSYSGSYSDVPPSEYESFLHRTLAECYRLASKDSWLVFWFAPEPWIDLVFKLICSVGFSTRRLCGIWTKHIGQTHHPEMYLGHAYEMFFYARKGDPKININKRGRTDIFSFDPVFPGNKIHPTERPVALMEEILSTFAYDGSRVLVPFAGSGNTLRAAFKLNMTPLGYDLSREYKDGYVSNILKEGQSTD